MFAPHTKFLVIDDFATMRKFIKKVLKEQGYFQISEAEDGASAWTLIQEAHGKGEPFQFIISDSEMPQVPGIQLLRACRQDQRFKDIPFLLLTAESDQKQILEAIKAGASNCLVKPVNARTLKQKIDQVYAKVTGAAKSA